MICLLGVLALLRCEASVIVLEEAAMKGREGEQMVSNHCSKIKQNVTESKHPLSFCLGVNGLLSLDSSCSPSESEHELWAIILAAAATCVDKE